MGALACLACASTLVLEGERWRHLPLGYTIDAPGPGWLVLGVEGADLAFRGPEGASLSLSSRCNTPLAPPRVLARHLVIGLPDRSLLQAGAVELEGQPGWAQRYEVQVEGRTHLLSSVTVVTHGCVIDFALVEPGSSQISQAAFERWWRSFRWSAEAGGTG